MNRIRNQADTLRNADERGGPEDEASASCRNLERDAETNTIAAAILATEQQVLELSDRDYEALLEAIANPPAPNDAMRRSIARARACIARS